eukprot:m.4523 g.4523  ORF g.4523 m.4523 type:complete len:220 (+) comp3911_c0_seq1:46-705(+)
MFRLALTRFSTGVRTSAVAHRNLCMSATRLSLKDALANEIAVEAEEGVPPTFPSTIGDFSLNYTERNPIVTLTSNPTPKETVTIRFNINDCDFPEDDELADVDNEELLAPQPVFSVNIANHDFGKTAMFNCMVVGGEFNVFQIGVKESHVSHDDEVDHAYMTNFSQLDDEVQQETLNYLANKGVGVEFLEQLEGLVADVEYNEYLGFLNDMSSIADASE